MPLVGMTETETEWIPETETKWVPVFSLYGIKSFLRSLSFPPILLLCPISSFLTLTVAFIILLSDFLCLPLILSVSVFLSLLLFPLNVYYVGNIHMDEVDFILITLFCSFVGLFIVLNSVGHLIDN